MYNEINYWKISTFILLGIILGYISGIYSKNNSQYKNSIELIISIKDSSNIKNDSTKLPLTESNLREELIKQGVKHHKIVLAQAKLESNCGKSSVAKRTNNLFGLRKGNRYRRFNHWTESVTAYKNLIQSKYEGGNYYVFLHKIGYAEDTKYIDKLKDLV